MLRAVRFCSQLGFEVDKKTISAIKKNKDLLLLVSKERWLMEMDKLLVGENLTNALILLNKTGLLKVMLNQFILRKKLQFTDMKPSNDPDLQWALLMKKILNSRDMSIENLTKIAFHLKWSKKRRKKVLTKVNSSGKIPIINRTKMS